jgi:hypothetical protein
MTLTTLEKETIWNLLTKYDTLVDRGFKEFERLTKSLSMLLKGELSNNDLLTIGSFLSNNTMNKVDSSRLDKIIGSEVDNLYFILS